MYTINHGTSMSGKLKKQQTAKYVGKAGVSSEKSAECPAGDAYVVEYCFGST